MNKKPYPKAKQSPSTSWESAGAWYNNTVGQEGHYYHQKVILPKILPLLNLKTDSSILDLGAGQGVLARSIPPNVKYVGVEISPTLLKEAKKLDPNPKHQYLLADATKELKLEFPPFSHATILLALQNMRDPEMAINNIAKHLTPKGALVLILNHPCFRIPRQSSWGIDEQKKLQYRRIDRYMSPMEIPIQTHPGKKESTETFSFHFSLSDLSKMLSKAGFTIDLIEEWCSDKESTGKNGKMENRARDEFPLFLALRAIKS